VIRPTEAQTFLYVQTGLYLNRRDAEYLKGEWDLAVAERAQPPN